MDLESTCAAVTGNEMSRRHPDLVSLWGSSNFMICDLSQGSTAGFSVDLS